LHIGKKVGAGQAAPSLRAWIDDLGEELVDRLRIVELSPCRARAIV
jgi:hypothetical protein